MMESAISGLGEAEQQRDNIHLNDQDERVPVRNFERPPTPYKGLCLAFSRTKLQQNKYIKEKRDVVYG